MDDVFEEFVVGGIKDRTVYDVSIPPESCSGDTHPNDFHNGSRVEGNGVESTWTVSTSKTWVVPTVPNLWVLLRVTNST